jgi:hypothetical protein
VLREDCAAIGGNAHEVMHEVAHVELVVVPHEGQVPNEVRRGVHKHQKFKVSDLLGALSAIIIGHVPNS